MTVTMIAIIIVSNTTTATANHKGVDTECRRFCVPENEHAAPWLTPLYKLFIKTKLQL